MGNPVSVQQTRWAVWTLRNHVLKEFLSLPWQCLRLASRGWGTATEHGLCIDVAFYEGKINEAF